MTHIRSFIHSQAIKHHASSVFVILSHVKHFACCHVLTNFTPNALINGCGWVELFYLLAHINRQHRTVKVTMTLWKLFSFFSIIFFFCCCCCCCWCSSCSTALMIIFLLLFFIIFLLPYSRIERVQSVVAMHRIISKVVAKSNKLQEPEQRNNKKWNNSTKKWFQEIINKK